MANKEAAPNPSKLVERRVRAPRCGVKDDERGESRHKHTRRCYSRGSRRRFRRGTKERSLRGFQHRSSKELLLEFPKRGFEKSIISIPRRELVASMIEPFKPQEVIGRNRIKSNPVELVGLRPRLSRAA